jgi:hypothetical protein
MTRKTRTPKPAPQLVAPADPGNPEYLAAAMANLEASQKGAPDFQEDPDPATVATPEPEPLPKSVIPKSYKQAYGKSANNGDEVATHLKGVELTILRHLAADMGINWTWDHLNPGMQRMNCGNRIRTLLKKKDPQATDAWEHWLEADDLDIEADLDAAQEA